jgi:hypothetical protein
MGKLLSLFRIMTLGWDKISVRVVHNWALMFIFGGKTPISDTLRQRFRLTRQASVGDGIKLREIAVEGR